MLGPRQPAMFAMGALDDWTSVRQCQARIDRSSLDRDLVETNVYPGAHHSFDALGLLVRSLAGVGNRSSPAAAAARITARTRPAWKAFVEDVKAFLARVFAR